MRISGIYKIESKKKPEKCYIGSAVNIYKRWSNHVGSLRNGNHKNRKLQNHFNKYGEADLTFSILLGCENEYLIANEQFFIDSYKPWFNICQTAASQLGMKRSESVKLGISKRFKGRVSPRKGVKLSDETKALMRAANLGKKLSEETKKKMSESQIRIGNKPPLNLGNNHLLGHHASEETKRKMSLLRKGKKQPEGFGQKIKDSWVIRKQNKSA